MTTFSTNIIITVEHLNYGNHVGYNAYLTITQEARMRWLKQHGMTEVNLGNNIGYIVTKVIMEYKAESFHGDTLTIDVSCIKQHIKKFKFLYTIKNTDSGKLVAAGETEQVFLDHNTKKIIAIPKKFSEIFL